MVEWELTKVGGLNLLMLPKPTDLLPPLPKQDTVHLFLTWLYQLEKDRTGLSVWRNAAMNSNNLSLSLPSSSCVINSHKLESQWCTSKSVKCSCHGRGTEHATAHISALPLNRLGGLVAMNCTYLCLFGQLWVWTWQGELKGKMFHSHQNV